ncbi:MAG: hypothetical protein KAQ83_03720 [Nanoarchaeota archaeon]|nr:hypothetical protein [Nanoarchaeota archaeon]
MYKKILIIFGIFLVIVITIMAKGAEGVRINNIPDQSAPICYDSDAGFNIYEPGRIFLGGVFAGEDYCQKYVYLHEFICKGPNVIEIIHHCTGGGCDDGTCFVD